MNLEEQIGIGILGRESEAVAIASFDPLGRQPPEFPAQGGDVPVSGFRWQTQGLERSYQVVGPEDHLHEGGVGPKASGRDLGHVVRALELAQEEFLGGPIAVEAPDGFGSQIEMGHQGPVVGVTAEGEQVLLRLFRLEAHRSSHRHKAVFLLPVERGIGKLGGLPSFGKIVVASLDHPLPEGLGHPSDDHVSQASLVERKGDLPVVESPIEPETGTGSGDRAGQLVDLGFQEHPSSGRGVDVAGAKLHPEGESRRALAGKNGSVGAVAVPPLGDVAQGDSFLMPIGDESGRIGVHDGAVSQVQKWKQNGATPVVGCLEAAQVSRAEPPQEGAQGIAVREVGQAQQRGDQSVVDQRLRILDPTDSRDDGEEVCQEQVCRMIGAVMVSWLADIRLEKPPQAEGVAKLVEKAQSPEAGKARRLDEKLEFSRSFWHPAQSYLKGSFVQDLFYRRYKCPLET